MERSFTIGSQRKLKLQAPRAAGNRLIIAAAFLNFTNKIDIDIDIDNEAIRVFKARDHHCPAEKRR
jgi:hypothetical protein